jgi:hypothetical protein
MASVIFVRSSVTPDLDLSSTELCVVEQKCGLCGSLLLECDGCALCFAGRSDLNGRNFSAGDVLDLSQV